MAELSGYHPSEDELVALALGEPAGPDEARLLGHLADCAPCRLPYDAFVRTLDAHLAAAPVEAPPVGFETGVLDALGHGASTTTRRRAPWLVAAAAVVGLALGAGGTALLDVAGPDEAPDAPVAAVAGDSRLVTGDGDTVGTVSHSFHDGTEVLVMQITDGPAGKYYRCRLRLDDGSTVPAGEWTVPESGQAVWIATDAPGAVGVELVTGDGTVWAAADLDDADS